MGEYTEFTEISDNYFYGTAGSQLTEICPQNNVTDERLQNIVIERNLFSETSGGKGLQLSGVNISVRDNVFNANTGGSTWGILAAKRGVEWTFTAGAPVDSNAPELLEIYNNTCIKNSNCIGLNAGGNISPANNSFAMNTLMFAQRDGGTACTRTQVARGTPSATIPARSRITLPSRTPAPRSRRLRTSSPVPITQGPQALMCSLTRWGPHGSPQAMT